MKLLCIFAVLLAISLADEIKPEENIESLLGLPSTEVDPKPIVISETPRRKIKRRVVRPRFYGSNTHQNNYNQPQNNYNNPQNNWSNNQDTWNKPDPQNNWSNNQDSMNNGYPSNNWEKPTSAPVQPAWTTSAPVQSTWPQAPASTSSTTTPIPVIKNEHTIGDNGSYKYEYEIADGTHVMEEGYVLNPNTENEIVVKKGMYSFKAADGKIYTVTYWADDTGYHATGAHLPTPHPIPAAIQESLDAQAEAEKNKEQALNPPKPIKPPTQMKPQPQPQPKPQPPQKYPNQESTYPGQQQNWQQGYPNQQQNQGYPSQQQNQGYPSQQQNQGYPSQQQNQGYPSQQQNQGYPSQQQNQGYPSQQQTYPQEQPNFYPPQSYGK
ncbi:uncharacterized protein DDB_G0283357-like isoform X1 [Pieris napi]|uniref:uncharacterized protein DDB_G0283357-like isoform X1 n=1 Tax=Pieris napi TaxID=78633 RepID=UPI001FBC0B77|nr:uncharacterized protein DDB_G0283357-like isoform X1 [Pieris napi]